MSAICTPVFAATDSPAPQAEPQAQDGGQTQTYVCAKHELDDGVIEKESTCLDYGRIHYHCKNCGADMGVFKIPKKEHTPSENGMIFLEPTCMSVGQRNFYCTECGELVYAKAILPTECTPGEERITKKPTRTEEGEKEIYCDVCHRLIKTVKIPKLDKDPEPTKAPKPSASPAPTKPPKPSASPVPTKAPVATPEPTATPAPLPPHVHDWVNNEDCQYCTGCDAINHYHIYDNVWKYNEGGHWQECRILRCGNRKNFAEHDWVVEKGKVYCAVCGYVQFAPTPEPTPIPEPEPEPVYVPQPTPTPIIIYRPAPSDVEDEPDATPTPSPDREEDDALVPDTPYPETNPGEENTEPADKDVSDTEKEEAAAEKKDFISASVPIFFENSGYDESGLFFAGVLPFRIWNSCTMEIQDIDVKAYNGWSLKPYEGDVSMGTKQVSAIINRCPTSANNFHFDARYFTVPVPANSFMEIPFKVCANKDDWTLEKNSPLKVEFTIGQSTEH